MKLIACLNNNNYDNHNNHNNNDNSNNNDNDISGDILLSHSLDHEVAGVSYHYEAN